MAFLTFLLSGCFSLSQNSSQSSTEQLGSSSSNGSVASLLSSLDSSLPTPSSLGYNVPSTDTPEWELNTKHANRDGLVDFYNSLITKGVRHIGGFQAFDASSIDWKEDIYNVTPTGLIAGGYDIQVFIIRGKYDVHRTYLYCGGEVMQHEGDSYEMVVPWDYDADGKMDFFAFGWCHLSRTFTLNLECFTPETHSMRMVARQIETYGQSATPMYTFAYREGRIYLSTILLEYRGGSFVCDGFTHLAKDR